MFERWVTRIALTMAGVLVGHWIAYALAHPVSSARALALGGSHGYLAGWFAIVLPIAGLLIGRESIRLWKLGRMGTINPMKLSVAMAGGFFVQEAIERLITGHGLTAIVSERAVWIGLLIQCILAFVAARICQVAVVLRHRYRRTGVAPAPTDSVQWLPSSAPIARLHLFLVAHPKRGPPRLLVTQ